MTAATATTNESSMAPPPECSFTFTVNVKTEKVTDPAASTLRDSQTLSDYA